MDERDMSHRPPFLAAQSGSYTRLRQSTYRGQRRVNASTTELKGAYFELMKEQISENGDREIRIQTFWSSQNRHHLWTVHADQNNNPVAEAFRMGSPLWLLDTNKEPLGEVGRYKDYWSGLTRMTAYQPSVPPVRTLVAVPLFCRRRLGIYFIEIPQYIERNSVATSELKRMADALAILLELWYLNRTQGEYTSEAIADLNQMLAASKFPRLANTAAALPKPFGMGGRRGWWRCRPPAARPQRGHLDG
jgi:hypothetical protein